jgi:hydrogenase expression/formation protein HypE
MAPEAAEAMTDSLPMACPSPLAGPDSISMAHGGGGTVMHALIEEILAEFGYEGERHDGAVLDLPASKIAFTTDSYVVQPLFFPGGDIGSLAVYGTVNDLSMCGAMPVWMSVALILEEGLPLEVLRRIVRSMAEAASRTGVQLVTGDTKVVESGKADGVFVNTAGIGIVREGIIISPSRIRPGDAVILSGDLGRHGIAVLLAREGIRMESTLLSDLAPLGGIVQAVLDTGAEVRCLRDLTRGGLASALNEIARSSGLGIRIEEERIPVSPEVRGACELLGFDPLYVANEGRFVAFVEASDSGRVLDALSRFPGAGEAGIIGTVTGPGDAAVTMLTRVGTARIVDMLSGEQLPRIC